MVSTSHASHLRPRVALVAGWLLVVSLTASCARQADQNADVATAPPADAYTSSSSGSVVLITIDTLRADHLPLYGYRGVKTPHLEALAAESVVFENAHAHAPITLPSHASILSGLYPPQHGLRNNGAYTANAELETLAERLSARGYQTGAFVSAFVLDSRFGLDQGFDHYDDDLEDGRQRWSAFGVKDRRAGMTINRALAWVKNLESERPFFSWVHLYDPHFEYAAPEPFRSRYPNPYDAEIAYADDQLGRLFAALRSRPDYDDLTIVVTADHGESLGEHQESTHSLFVYEATQHVPLLIRFPQKVRAGTRSDQVARHVDIVPTVLDSLGLQTEINAQTMPGRSLLSALDVPEGQPSAVVYAEAMLPMEQFGWAPIFSLQQGSFKYIEAPQPELYDLTIDPHELNNLVDDQPERATALAATLRSLSESIGTQSPTASAQEMDDETRTQLIALGYLTGDEPRASERGRDPKDMVGLYEGREKAHRAMDEGAYERALSLLNEILKSDPSNPALLGDRAACLAELKRWPAAERAYQALLEAHPDRAGYLAALAKIHFLGQKDFARAHRELDVAMRLEPNEPSYWGIRGDLLHEEKRYAEAVTSYRKALDLGDVTPSYLLGLASALHLTGDTREAREVIERMIQIDNDNAIGHYNHGVILSALDLHAAAEGALREAIRIDPQLASAYRTLSNMLLERDRARDAIDVLREAVASVSNADIALQLARLEVRAGFFDEGIARFERSVERAPNAPIVRLDLAVAYRQARRLAEANNAVETVINSLPERAPLRCVAFLERARNRAHANETSSARASVDKARRCGGQGIANQIRRDPILAALATASPTG